MPFKTTTSRFPPSSDSGDVSADRPSHSPHTSLAAFQANIDAIYGEKDRARGVPSTYQWFVEEVGELARALRRGEPENLSEEFSDVLAWLATLATLAGTDLELAASRYSDGCPRCHATPCDCQRGARPSLTSLTTCE